MAKVTMPQLGESVAEGTIGKWLKQPGDTVEKYEPLLEVITDKVNAEVPSPFAGILKEILVQEGETVPPRAARAMPDRPRQRLRLLLRRPPRPPRSRPPRPWSPPTAPPAPTSGPSARPRAHRLRPPPSPPIWATRPATPTPG